MSAVADASPLILFARALHLHVLHLLFGELWIPPLVAREVCGDPTRPGALAVAAAVGHWIHERAPASRASALQVAGVLDAGEAEAIALAAELGLLLIVDDPTGRRVASAQDVPILGSAGVAGLAKRHGIVPAVRPLLDRLIAEGLRLSRPLYAQVLADSGELAP
jgi:predicted nucleic acid-binding protein